MPFAHKSDKTSISHVMSHVDHGGGGRRGTRLSVTFGILHTWYSSIIKTTKIVTEVK